MREFLRGMAVFQGGRGVTNSDNAGQGGRGGCSENPSIWRTSFGNGPFVVPAVEQSIKDCSSVGNWRDEKDYVLMKIHGWFFMSWMTTKLSLTGEIFLPIGTLFYSEILRMCQFQEYLIQVL